MAEALGRVEVEISANTAQFEQALARARALASGLKDIQLGGGGAGSTALRNYTNDARKAALATREFGDENNKLKMAFRDVATALSTIQGPLGPIAGRFGFLGTMIGRVGVEAAGFGVAIAGLVLSANEAVDAFAEEEKQLLTLQAVLKATGGAAGQTADSLGDLEKAISTTTMATDDQVRSAETLMLTFRKISGEEFPRAMRAAQDLAATGFGSIEGNARQLGRALEDPIRGLNALRRSGVTFSEQQRQVIKNLVETGQAAAAQREVLKAIEIQVGGAGAAQASGTAGAFHQLSESVNNVTVAFGQWLAKTLKIPEAARAAAAGLNALLDHGDQLEVKVGDLTLTFDRYVTSIEKAAIKAKEAAEALKQQTYAVQEAARVKAILDRQAAGEDPSKFGLGMTPQTDEQLKQFTASSEQAQEGVRALNGYIYDAIKAFQAWQAVMREANAEALRRADAIDGVRISLVQQQQALLRTTEEQKVYDLITKAGIAPLTDEAKAIGVVVHQLTLMEDSLRQAGGAGVNLDKLKEQFRAIQTASVITGVGGPSKSTEVDETNLTIAAMQRRLDKDREISAQEAKAVTIEEKTAAARARAAFDEANNLNDTIALMKIKNAGLKTEQDLTIAKQKAEASRILTQRQNLESQNLEIQLVGKSIEEQTRLRTELQLTQEAKRRWAEDGVKYTEEMAAADKKYADQVADDAAKLSAANLKLQTDFESQSMFLSQTEQKVAQALQAQWGDQWQAHMHDNIAQQIRFNAVLQDTYSATRDFAGTFTEGLLAGKSATDALTDALGNLQKKLIDMALDAVIQGLFGLLLGQGTTGGNVFSNLVNFTSGGGTSANTSKAPRRYAEGGVVGSTPRPLYKGEPLAYDEYPAILHTGETVVPVGGKNLHLSGKDMTEMFGGVPKLEGGWNAAAEAAGGYQAGDTGATGHWGTTSGGGGNVTLSNLAASQFTSTGGGSISLGSGHGGGGGSISVPIPRLRIAAPRIVAPAPIVVAPVIAPVVVPDVVPLPRERDWTKQLLESIPDFSPLTSPEQLLPDVVFGPASRPVKTTTVTPSSTTPPSRMIPTTATPPSPAPVTVRGSSDTGGIGFGFEPTVAHSWSSLQGSASPASPASPASSFNVGSGIMPQIGGFHTAGSSDPATAGSRGLYPILNTLFMQSALADRMDYPADVPLPRPRPSHHEPFASQLGYGAGLGAARNPFRIATDPRKSVKNVIAPTNPDIDVIPPVFGGLPVQPGLGLYPPPPGLPLPRSDATMGPMTPIDTGKTGFGQVAIPALRLLNSIFGIGQSNQPLPAPASKAPAPYDDGGAKANIKEQYDSIMKNIKRGSTGPSSMLLDPRAAGQLAGGTDELAMQTAMGLVATGPWPGRDGRPGSIVGEEPSTYDTMIAHPEQAGSDIIDAAGSTLGDLAYDLAYGYGQLVGKPIAQGIDYITAAIMGVGQGTHLGVQTNAEVLEYNKAIERSVSNWKALPGPQLGPGNRLQSSFTPRIGSSLHRQSQNIIDLRPRDAAGELIPTMSQYHGPRLIDQMIYYDQTRKMREVLPNGMLPSYEHHGGGVVGSTPVPRRWVSASMFDHAPRFQAGLAANEYPAILHAGETVTPVSGQQRSSGNVIINSPAQAPPNVTVNVTNNSNAQVSTNNSQDGSGGVKIDIMIDEMVAAKMRDGGSLISRTLGSMGARSQPVRR